MGMEGIKNGFYDFFTQRFQPALMFCLGIGCIIFLSVTKVHSAESMISAAYIIYETVDGFLDEMCDTAMDRSVADSNTAPTRNYVRSLQGLSAVVCVVFMLYVALQLINAGSDISAELILGVLLFATSVFVKSFENIMEVSFVDQSIAYKKLAFEIMDRHVTSVIRDGYRLFLSEVNPSAIECEGVKGQIEQMGSTFTSDTLRLLKYESRVKCILEVLRSSIEHGYGALRGGTGTEIYSYFGMNDVVTRDLTRPPVALRQALDETCPFHKTALVRDTHIYFFLPAKIIDDETNGDTPTTLSMSVFGDRRNSTRKSTPPTTMSRTTNRVYNHTELFDENNSWIANTNLTAKVMGEKAKNFIPGVGVVWRYEPIKEEPRDADRWVLMYRGLPRNDVNPVTNDGTNDETTAATTLPDLTINDGIIPGTFNTSWNESNVILKELNEAILVRTNDTSSTHRLYKAMTNAEIVAGTFSHFVRTGEAMFHERFTRVVEETETKQFQGICGGQPTSHLFIGRFNMSGLNNDAYLDVGGDECRHHLRGLSLCRRFEMD